MATFDSGQMWTARRVFDATHAAASQQIDLAVQKAAKQNIPPVFDLFGQLVLATLFKQGLWLVLAELHTIHSGPVAKDQTVQTLYVGLPDNIREELEQEFQKFSSRLSDLPHFSSVVSVCDKVPDDLRDVFREMTTVSHSALRILADIMRETMKNGHIFPPGGFRIGGED